MNKTIKQFYFFMMTGGSIKKVSEKVVATFVFGDFKKDFEMKTYEWAIFIYPYINI